MDNRCDGGIVPAVVGTGGAARVMIRPFRGVRLGILALAILASGCAHNGLWRAFHHAYPAPAAAAPPPPPMPPPPPPPPPPPIALGFGQEPPPYASGTGGVPGPHRHHHAKSAGRRPNGNANHTKMMGAIGDTSALSYSMHGSAAGYGVRPRAGGKAKPVRGAAHSTHDDDAAGAANGIADDGAPPRTANESGRGAENGRPYCAEIRERASQEDCDAYKQTKNNVEIGDIYIHSSKVMQVAVPSKVTVSIPFHMSEKEVKAAAEAVDSNDNVTPTKANLSPKMVVQLDGNGDFLVTDHDPHIGGVKDVNANLVDQKVSLTEGENPNVKFWVIPKKKGKNLKFFVRLTPRYDDENGVAHPIFGKQADQTVEVDYTYESGWSEFWNYAQQDFSHMAAIIGALAALIVAVERLWRVIRGRRRRAAA